MPEIPRVTRRIPVALAATARESFAPVSRAAALALEDVGVAAFFIAGVLAPTVGAGAVWVVLAAALVGLACRAADIDGWTLFVPGGSIGRVRAAFGARSAAVASAAGLVERLLIAALACTIAGHYAATGVFALGGGLGLARRVQPQDVATLVAVGLLGFMWIRSRLGYASGVRRAVRQIWIAMGLLLPLPVAGALLVLHAPERLATVAAWPSPIDSAPSALAAFVGGLVSLGLALPVVGAGEPFTRVAAELPPPRVAGLWRTALCVTLYALFVTTATTLVFVLLVPGGAERLFVDAPLLGVAQYVTGWPSARTLLTVSVLAAAALVLPQAARAGLADAEAGLSRVAGLLPFALRLPEPRFGTHIDAAAAAVLLAIVASGGNIAWLAGAYAVAVAALLALKIASVARLRTRGRRPSARPSEPPAVRVTRRGLAARWTLAIAIAAAGVAVLASGNPGAWAGTMMAGVLAALSVVRSAHDEPSIDDPDAFQLLPSSELSIEQVEARPGGVLVAVRNPNALGPLSVALAGAGDRDIVVMTARLPGVDADDDGGEARPTSGERALFSRAITVAERYHRSIRLLIVPARDVFDAVITAVLRLQSSEVHVGESSTLTADAQARLLGDAWERAEKTGHEGVRLVVHHRSGRADVYHLGAHAPALSPKDLDLIHRLWLDAVKAVGPDVHHHDVVRAALTQMAEQMNGAGRDQALQAIRRTARPADELAAVVKERDYSRLRDMVRNRAPSDLAELLGGLSLEDQVVVFRLLPRKDAASAFEYLDHDAQETLLKAMAQEDVAKLLNDMSPDDRTMFLEELPAAATRQLLALLTPEERAVAVTLLGYPEGSVGRLMTPEYVRVREDWTVQQVLNHVRAHGHDSETLNVIYVVDDRMQLIDDLRIREILLAPPSRPVSDLMDRRFVALRATDDQQTAVALFKTYDRSALPVTDSAGTLIGIVTVDDVLDVAEAAATKDIQRIGGSEALDEPYTEIAFPRMIQKRAGWLTALFLGEMLTATAMGAFEQEIQRAVVLALFVPLIISSGGNSGSQASTLVIRALALGEVGLRDWWRVIRREIAAGLVLGGILGSVGFARIAIWSTFSDVYGEHWLLVGVTVSLALVGIVLWGTLVGSLLPFVLRRLGFDPATSSAPAVATLVDVTGLVIYFSVAMVVLRGTLL